MSNLTEKIESHVEPIIKDLGYEIVRVAFVWAQKTKTLQIMIEKPDETQITIDDCEIVSKAVSVGLDVINPIRERYNLEISSAGIDRPLIKPSDFVRFIKKPVVIKTYVEKNGKKVFKGLLESATEHGIKLQQDVSFSEENPSIEEFGYSEIKYAHIDGFKL